MSTERRNGSGRVTKKIPKSKRKRLAQYFNHQTGKSQRVAARKFGITQAYVCQILQAEGVRCRKKEKIPDRTEQQAAAERPKCRNLAKKYQNEEIILCDETYLTLANSTLIKVPQIINRSWSDI